MEKMQTQRKLNAKFIFITGYIELFGDLLAAKSTLHMQLSQFLQCYTIFDTQWTVARLYYKIDIEKSREINGANHFHLKLHK